MIERIDDIYNINWDDLEWEIVREGIRRKIYQAKNLTVTYNEAHKRHTTWPHSHEYEKIVIWLSGENAFYVRGIPRRMKAGGIMVIPPNVEHYSMCVSD